MIDSWKLATLSMWIEKLPKEEAIKLMCDTFTWEELWEGAAELNQLCAARNMDKKIPRNIDQGDKRDRVKILASAVYSSIMELKGRDDKPNFVASSEGLFLVPGVLKDTVRAEPAVTARLDNIEKVMEEITRALGELKASRVNHFPALQVNGSPAPAQRGSQPNNQVGGILSHQGCSLVAPGQQVGSNRVSNSAQGQRNRSLSPSMKRSADEAGLQGNSNTQTGQETPCGLM